MFFEFNNDKKFRRNELAYAIFNNFTISFMFSALAYAICNLIGIFIFDNLDVISIRYMLCFVVLCVVIFSALMLLFYKTDKGVTITNNAIVFSTGYFSKAHSFKTAILIDEIVSIEAVELFNLVKVLKADYRNYNYKWVLIGANSKNLTLVKIQTKNDVNYLLPIQDISGFINYTNK